MSSTMEFKIEEQSPCERYVRYNKILGRGAFKEVYRGFDRVANTEIAWNQITLYDERDLNSREIQENLCSEAVMLNSLNHKNIMKCFTHWIDHGKRSMNMITELLDSGSLRQHTNKQGEIDVPTMKNWGRQILRGIKYLHEQNPQIIHRDLKCDNVFLDINNDSIKIGDFGLAATMEDNSPLHKLAGTPEFMAPEYYNEEYNELVDIYAFGMCLIEMATCECPYSECTNPCQIFKKVTNGVKPLALNKVKDNEVRRVIDMCLSLANVRPSALELLKDSFFLDDEILMEERHSCELDSFLSVGEDMSRSDGTSLSSGLDVAISMEDDKSVEANKDYCYYMDESILSDISASYNDDSWKVDEYADSCHKSSLMDDGDVSMNLKVTFESSSGVTMNYVNS